MALGSTALIVITVAITVLLLEVVVRTWGYSARYMYDPVYTHYDQCDTSLVVHKPNLHNVLARGMTVFSTDSLGLRSLHSGEIRYDKPPGEMRIAIVGDSFTFGHGISNTADTYPAVLENILNSESGGALRYRVFNFGVSAYSLAEMTATLNCRMLEIKPDIVICAFIFDDFDPNRMVKVDEYGYTNRRNHNYCVDNFPTLKHLLRRSHLFYLVRDALKVILSKENGESSAKDHVEGSYGHFQDFRRIALQNHIKYLLLLLPSYGSDDLLAVKRKLAQDRFQCLDLSSLWKNYSLEEFRVSRFDNHPSVIVHKEIAVKTAEYLRETLLIPGDARN